MVEEAFRSLTCLTSREQLILLCNAMGCVVALVGNSSLEYEAVVDRNSDTNRFGFIIKMGQGGRTYVKSVRFLVLGLELESWVRFRVR